MLLKLKLRTKKKKHTHTTFAKCFPKPFDQTSAKQLKLEIIYKKNWLKNK